jgi:hypothetical protein
MADVGILRGHLVYFMAIRYIFGCFVIFPRFGKLYQDNSGNPESRQTDGSDRNAKRWSAIVGNCR